MSCIIFAQPGKIKPPEDIYADTKKSPQIYLGRQILQSPGSYLIKARNNFLTGFGCQILAVGIICVVPPPSNNTPGFDSKLVYIGAGTLSLVGLGLEISGIVNIGKAGIALNQNGIGLKVKF